MMPIPNNTNTNPPFPSGAHHKVALPGSKEEEEASRKKKKGRPKKQPLPAEVLEMDY